MATPDGLYRRLQQMQNLDTSDHGLKAREDLGRAAESTEGAKTTEVEGVADLEPSKEQIASNSRRAWHLGKKYLSCKANGVHHISTEFYGCESLTISSFCFSHFAWNGRRPTLGALLSCLGYHLRLHD